MSADRNLLFGILALQMGLIKRDDLIRGMNAWVLEKFKPLAQILQDQGVLTQTSRDLLEPLVAHHLKENGGDAQKSLAAISSVSSLQASLRQIADPEVQASLIPLGQGSGPRAAPSSAASRFRILRPHARGGLGEVFVANDEELNREVALKEIQTQYAFQTDHRSRFLLEAEITGGLEHPGIVPVYGLGSYADGRPFYAMRFIKGDSLQEAINRFHAKDKAKRDPQERALALRELLGRYVDVCQAIAYAHSRGVLHRDLKPGNVMLGKYGETLVVDWGLAKATGGKASDERGMMKEERKTQPSGPPAGEITDAPTLIGPPDNTPLIHAVGRSTEPSTMPAPGLPERLLAPRSGSGVEATQIGQAVGTPAYMSPEQAAGRIDELGPASDVYSLGATLYHLLTGRPPFEERDMGMLLAHVQMGEFLWPREVSRSVPPALEAICLKAMALRPADRYASSQDLAQEIERWRADVPVRAYREPWTRRLGRWRRRHSALVTAASVLLVTVGIGVIMGFAIVGRQERRARALSQAEALPDAHAATVPALLEQIGDERAAVLPWLRTQWQDESLTQQRRLRIGLALADDPAVRAQLVALARKTDDPEEVVLVRQALQPYADELQPVLWPLVKDATQPAVERFRLAGVLAGMDPTAPDWPPVASMVTAQLLTTNTLYLGMWKDTLKPISGVLLEPLGIIFRKSQDGERRRLAATLCADYAAALPDVMADLLMDGDPKQFAVLFKAISSRREQIAAPLVAELGKLSMPPWPDMPLEAKWTKPSSEMVRQIVTAGGLLEERFAFCQTLPLGDFRVVAEGLRPAGYRPLCFRPTVVDGVVLTTAVWTRDGGEWRLDPGVAPAEAESRDTTARKAGFHAIDVAFYGERGNTRLAILWSKAPDDATEAQLAIGLDAANYKKRTEPLERDGWQMVTGVDSADAVMQAAIWNKPVAAKASKADEKATSVSRVSEKAYEVAVTGASGVQTNLRIGKAMLVPSNRERFSKQLAETEDQLRAAPYNGGLRYRRGEAYAWLGQYEKAVADFTWCIGKSMTQPQVLMQRAFSQARLGKSKEAAADLARLVESDPSAISKAYADAIVASYLGQHVKGMKRLELAIASARSDADFLYSAACAFAVSAGALATRDQARSMTYGDRAMQLLQDAVGMGYADYAHMNEDEDLEPLRGRPEFAALLAPVHLDRAYSARWLPCPGFESREIHGLGALEHSARSRELISQGFRPVLWALAQVQHGQPPVTASVWRRPRRTDLELDRLRQRQTNAAAAVVRLDQPERVWPLLGHVLDPTLRTYLIHRLGVLGAEGGTLLKRLDGEVDAGIRQALILSLGEFDLPNWPTSEREALVKKLQQIYQEEADAGVHGAARWLLGRLGQDAWIAKVTVEWSRDKVQLSNRIKAIQQSLAGMPVASAVPRWYVNGQGQTMVVIPGPREYLMGDSRNRSGDEAQRKMTLGHTFAIAATEVTRGQYQEFEKAADRGVSSNLPPDQLSWYDAAGYCNWLSEKEGIPESQRCYSPNRDGKYAEGMTIKANYLQLAGYRLPTEVEWELACRAGTVTSWHHGESEAMLEKYANYSHADDKLSDRRQAEIVGQLKPNDWGLFDMMGNLCEWTQEEYARSPSSGTQQVQSRKEDIKDSINRVLRGGAFSLRAVFARPASRTYFRPEYRNANYGFRPARTFPLGSFTPLQPPPKVPGK